MGKVDVNSNTEMDTNFLLLIRLIKENFKRIIIIVVMFSFIGGISIGGINKVKYENVVKIFYSFNDRIYRSDMIDYEDKNMYNVLEYLKINIEDYNDKKDDIKIEKVTSNIIKITIEGTNKEQIDNLNKKMTNIATSNDIKLLLNIDEGLIIGNKMICEEKDKFDIIIGSVLGAAIGFLFSILLIIFKKILNEK